MKVDKQTQRKYTRALLIAFGFCVLGSSLIFGIALSNETTLLAILLPTLIVLGIGSLIISKFVEKGIKNEKSV